MDDIVLRAIQKWPDVPHVFGWLRLDRRGQWLIRSRGEGAERAFERILNPAFIEFIGRNYACDEAGRWFFQNGPQRVFVSLDCTPWVYRLNETCDGLATHTGRAAGAVGGLLVDDNGLLLALGEPGVGAVDDRDVPALLERIGADFESLLEAGKPAQVDLFGRRVTLEPVRSAELPVRFGFDPQPRPAEGEPEC